MDAPITSLPRIDASQSLNEPILVPITVKEFVDVSAFSLTLNYDPTVLEYDTISESKEFSNMVVNTPAPGTIVIAASSDVPVSYPDFTELIGIVFIYKGGLTNLTWGDCGYTNADLDPMPDEPLELHYLPGVVGDRNVELKYWGQVFPVSAYGRADGVIKMHIQDGIAPFRVTLKVNGNIYREITDIPAAQFNYMTYDDATPPNYADTNCVITDLPPGEYSFVGFDSSAPEQMMMLIGVTWNSVSPPFATLNGTVNANGVPTIVTFEYGLTAEYGFVADFGIVNGNEPTHCSLQLSSGGYDKTSILVPDTDYHFRIVAHNVNGSSVGEDMMFTTPSAPAPLGPAAVTLPATGVTN